ncbi:hypothetical protein VP01_3127g4 [Puccinia sorghi]|uniref:Protein LTV1 n=1 Tax=Puccinia sorghi TaxID=27349 RepID=A0A0L6V107_9BASI|nr:hypothetical protein VP01_3127g4 [Puccinia sorghi]
MAPKSIFRGPDATHFALVHRSQRDPLINDEDASERVLHQGLTRNQLEASLGEPAANLRPNVGEASLYQIYYDDSEYDYMQHLKPPTPTDQMLSYQDHLQYALPANSAIPEDGLLPLDGDPALREVLEALEDDAYVEEETGDEFFGTIVKDGERDPSEVPEWIHDTHTQATPSSQWEAEMARFIPPSKKASTPLDETTSSIGSLPPPKLNQPQSNKRNLPPPSVRGSVAGSAFSMSSSAMFRNEGLTDLDDRFDQIEKEYESSDSDLEDSEDGHSEQSNMTATPRERRADFEAIMDEFLDKFEVIGGKMKPVMAGKTPVGKLETLRSELLGPGEQDSREERLAVKEQILKKLQAEQDAHHARPFSHIPKDRFTLLDGEKDHQNKWDCQTILTTYSNLENHPRVIRIRDAIGAAERKTVPAPNTESKIGIDRATGFPIVDGKIVKGKQNPSAPQDDDQDSNSDSDGDSSQGSIRTTLKRDRNEDTASKRARKAALKAERAARRQNKKSTKLAFVKQKNLQDQALDKLALKKAVDIGGVSGKGVIPLL